jgi:cyclohexa-1,5-dienecarbonyl-CoA hydratase
VSSAPRVQVGRAAGGTVASVRIAAGRGNVLARAVIAELSSAFEAIGRDAGVRAVLLTAEGPDFSYGASVPEHAPGEVARMLPELSALFRAIAAMALPVSVAVRGRCLGGALELAIAAHHLTAADDARMGFPEVTLGVFPPVAAALLPFRVRQPVADRLIGLGETISGAEAATLGLCDETAPQAEVEARALAWAERYRELSGVAVRFATRAARAAWDQALGARLERLERLYLDELMATADAREGVAAFLERRPPRWSDR